MVIYVIDRCQPEKISVLPSLSLSSRLWQGLSEVRELLLRLVCCKVSAVPGDGLDGLAST